MQKIINVLAVASFAVSGAVVASGVYVYVNRGAIIDEIKSQALGGLTGSLGVGGLPALPSGGAPTKITPAQVIPVPSTPAPIKF
tara:strand:- start:1618 stop:1869 length:252 start_codon:yes stop_codon:yes gene_type:complete